MKLTAHDKPLGQVMGGPARTTRVVQEEAKEVEEKPKPRTLAQAAKDHGLHPSSVYQFRGRHPECREWPPDKVCATMVANKDQSAVARRQGQAAAKGQRGRFGRMTYDEVTDDETG